ncbi:MAG: right-handed parallel beta-helix repeat-containing protein, partial [Phycisphaerales bacterium]
MRFLRTTHVVLLLAGVFCFSAAARAGITWYVDGNLDTCRDYADGGEEDTPFCSISYATLQASNSDTILVADGRYTYVNYGGKAITIKSQNGPEACIIDGTGELAVRFQSGETRESVLDGFKIINAGVHAIWMSDNSNPTIRNCIIRGNDSTESGAGIYCVNSSPLIENCEFTNNEAVAFGAAIYLEDGGSTEIIGCSFSGNRTTHGDSSGGAIFAFKATAGSSMSLTIKDSSFSQNTTVEVGGAMVVGADDGSGLRLPVRIENCTFEANESLMYGGAIYAVYAEPLEFVNTHFVNNTTRQRGGALALQSCPDTTFVDSTITDNSARGIPSLAGLGGGLWVSQSGVTSPHVRMLNCIIAGNSVAGRGGGIYHANGGNLFITNSLVVDNNATSGMTAEYGTGGAIYCAGPERVGVKNCTLTGNSSVTQAVFHTESVINFVDIYNSVIWDNTPEHMSHGQLTDVEVSYSFVQGGVQSQWDGGGNIGWDETEEPLFEDVVNFRRPWSQNDYHLTTSSPCIDAGSDLLVYADTQDLDGDGDTTERIPLDLEGSYRIADSRDVPDTGVADPPDYPAVVDMGAYEMAAYCIGEELEPPAEIAGKVDFAETVAVGGINPSTAAFYHACVPSSAGGDDCAREAIFAAEEKVNIRINWQYLENPDDWEYQEWSVKYRTGRCVAEDATEYAVAATKYYKSYPEATVILEDYYDVVIHYNGVIGENLPEDGGDETVGNPDIRILPNGEIQVTEGCADGRIVLEYNKYLGGPLVGLEIVQITSEGAALYAGPLQGGAVPVGRLLEAPGGGDHCRAVVIRNTEE